MEDEFKRLNFHSLQRITKPQPQSLESEFSELEGIACLDCKETCIGFEQNRWRRSCKNCKCPVWRHDIPSTFIEHPFAQLCVEEKVPLLESEYERGTNEGYEWFPRGLLSSQVGSIGADQRARQLVYQIPKQDFNAKHALFLTDARSQSSFEEMKKRTMKDSIGIGSVRGAISTTTTCATCSGDIRAGNMAVFAKRFDHSFAWHPQCFKCCVDGDMLVDLIYFNWERRLYCGRHYGELFKPRCNGCEELIYVGEYTKAMQKAWHKNHFCCWQCDSLLTSMNYTVINDHPFCQKCYTSLIANVCRMCREPIEPGCKDLYVKDRHYHGKCLACAGCQVSLEKQTFSFVNDKPICHQCRGIGSPDQIQTCYECGSDFKSGEKQIGIRDQYYHEECFICSLCHHKIAATTKFIQKSDGQKLCNTCFEKTAKVCCKCNDVIKKSIVQFEEQNYHPHCFVCMNCKKRIGGIQFYKHKEELYCEECHITRNSKRCAQCYKLIKENTPFVDYESKHWHSTCFVCVVCEEKLVGSKFVMRNGCRFCLDCREKAPMTMV